MFVEFSECLIVGMCGFTEPELTAGFNYTTLVCVERIPPESGILAINEGGFIIGQVISYRTVYL